MIDLHTHVLAGVDDGPAEREGSIAIAREAAENGVTILAATPHVRDDYPTTSESMLEAVATVKQWLREADIAVDVLPGGEIAFDRLAAAHPDRLRPFGLAGSKSHLLVEMPVFGWPLDALEQVRRLRGAGMTMVLAHPERNIAVQSSPGRLAELVQEGALVQVTAGSLLGNFGKPAMSTARMLIADGLVHLVASDVHRAADRGKALVPALATLRDPALARWLTHEVPGAIIAGAPVPQRPSPRPRWRRGGHARTASRR